MIDLASVTDLAAWPKSRSKIESKINAVLGPIQKEAPDLQLKVTEELDFGNYSRRRVNYFVDDWERATAWYFVPEGAEDCPAIVCLHDRQPGGKDVPAGVTGDPHLAFAQRFAELGYATLAPDCITAGDRVLGSRVPFDSTSWYADHAKGCLLGKILSDHLRALDVLGECPEVDADRIAVIGHGFGGANALLLAAMDERVRVAVSSCGFVPFSQDENVSRWVEDDGLALIPKLKSAISSGKFPFDWEHILALIAPNATLLLTAQNDETVPGAKHCKEAIKAAAQIYGLLGEGSALEEYRHKDGHRMTFELMERAGAWFERWL